MDGVQGDPTATAALLVLNELDVAMTARVAAENFDVLSEDEATKLLEQLEAFGHVEQIEDGLYRKTADSEPFTRSGRDPASAPSD